MKREFHRLLAGEAVSNFGSMLSRVAIPWLAALELAASPLEMGFLVVADVAAGAGGTLVLGTLVDRTGKRAAMLATDVLRAVVLGALAVLAATGHLTFIALALAAAVSGLLTVGFEMARSAWMAERLAAGELPARNAQMSAATSLSETVAFALGGWLYQGLGAVFALAIDALSYMVSALFVRGIRESQPALAGAHATAESPTSMGAQIREGLAANFSHPTLRRLAGAEVLVALGMSLAGTSYMIWVARDLGFGTGTLGLIFATGGLGALLGAAVAPRLGRILGRGNALTTGLVLLAAGAILIPLAPGPTALGVALLVAHQIIGDGGYAIYDVFDRTLRQTSVAPGLLARVDAGLRTLGQCARLAGAIGGGALATAFGTRQALIASAALLACAALLLMARPIRS